MWWTGKEEPATRGVRVVGRQDRGKGEGCIIAVWRIWVRSLRMAIPLVCWAHIGTSLLDFVREYRRGGAIY